MILLADLLDRRARVQSSGDVVAFLLSIVPAAVASIVPLYGPIADALRSVPAVARFIHVLVPIALLILSVHVLVLRRQEHSIQPKRTGDWVYTYNRGYRTAAKVALLPLLALALVELNDKLPNTLLRRTIVRAYVCEVGDVGMQQLPPALISLHDSFGNLVAGPMRPDDTGYVSLPLSGWGQRPVSIAVSSPCTVVSPSLRTQLTTTGCAGMTVPLPQRRPSFVWNVSCTR